MNNITYPMSIAYKEGIQPTGDINDWLIITNYGNKFNLRVNYFCHKPPMVVLLFATAFPCYDNNNKRWSLSIESDDTTTTRFYENELKNDTIILYYELSNIAFYYQDSVPYYDAKIKHIAVKQH